MRLSEQERIGIRDIGVVARIDGTYPPGTRIPRQESASYDRFFFLSAPGTEPTEGGELLMQRWNGGSVSLSAGDAVLIPRRVRYEDCVIRPHDSVLVIADFDLPAEDGITRWHFSENGEMFRNFQSLLQIWDRKAAGWYARCMRTLYDMLLLIIRREREQYADPKQAILAPAVDYMRAHFPDGAVPIPELAERCRLSYSRFRELFSACYGVPAKTYLAGLRLETAKNLLKIGDLPVSEVARRCGFADPYYFSNFFKKSTGQSPVDFRDPIR